MTADKAHILRIRAWLLACALTSALLVLASLPPFVSEELRQLLMVAFSGVCHQISSRSPHIDGIQLAVCDRCFGIYAALAAGTIVYLAFRRWDDPINRHARFVVPACVLVPGIDWFGDAVGLWMNTPLSRMLTGAVFGLGVGYFFARAIVQLLRPRRTTPLQRETGILTTASDGSK